MKKSLLCFITGLFLAQNCALAAITVKKASSVAKKETKVQDVGASLLPTAINLYSTIKQLNQQQQALSAECEPTSQEINWVNNMIKEWAKAGGMFSEGTAVAGMNKCGDSADYAASIRQNVESGGTICYDYFKADSTASTAVKNVWDNFPKASVATYYMVDGEYQSSGNAKNKQVASNIYDIFNLIDFSTEDYTASEATMASKLMEKMEKCAPAKLKAKKLAMWGDFAMTTVGSIGQKTNTGSIAEAVSGIVSSGGGMGGALQSLSGIATQFLQ